MLRRRHDAEGLMLICALCCHYDIFDMLLMPSANMLSPLRCRTPPPPRYAIAIRHAAEEVQVR